MKKRFTVFLSVLLALTVLSCFLFLPVGCFAQIPIFTSSDGKWKYSLINGDEAYITSADSTQAAYCGEGGDIVIPAYIDGHKVYGIAQSAFYGIDGITSISVAGELERNSLDFENGMTCVTEYYCYKNSPADSFARQNSRLSSIVKYFGDVNSDGTIDLADYTLIAGYLADEQAASFNEIQLHVADYNADTSVDGFDLYYVDRIINSGIKIVGNDDDSHYAIIDWD